MTTMRRVTPFVVLFAGLCLALPAQGTKPAKSNSGKPEKVEKSKSKSKDKDKAAAKDAVKDDALTAKDPVITAIDKFRKAKVSTKRADWKTTLPEPPLQAFDGKREFQWHLETSKGQITIRLLPDAAPRHVTSTIYLARCGFYDGLTFPRILKGFMAQGGSPTNDQQGNAGYTMDGEFLTGRKHDSAGILSAANSGSPNTDGSQFFLTFVPTPHLDGKHTVYGVVTEGLEVLKAIEACGVEKDGDTLSETPSIVRSWIRVVEPVPEKH
jgi:peptidyl-prolyl cis-trans isomerase B (cyclophilin B)